MINRRSFLQHTATAATSAALFPALFAAAAKAGRPPRVLLRSSWQSVNIGDIGHTPGALSLLWKHFPEVEITLWPGNLGHGSRQLLTAGYPRLKIVEGSLGKVYPLLTPSYRREFEDRAVKDIIPQARDRQLVSQANVVGVGVLEAQRDSASVMVYMNRTVTDKSRQPIYDGSRLRVDYQKIDGKWLINYITPI